MRVCAWVFEGVLQEDIQLEELKNCSDWFCVERCKCTRENACVSVHSIWRRECTPYWAEEAARQREKGTRDGDEYCRGGGDVRECIERFAPMCANVVTE